MAKKIADVIAPRTTALSPEEILRKQRETAQMIEFAQGGRYAGSPYVPQFEDAPVRPVKA